jgi:hypothetical protein
VGSQRVAIGVTVGSGVGFPAHLQSTALATAPPVIGPGLAILQPLGVSSALTQVKIPGLTANTPVDVPFTVALNGFPSPFSITVNSTGFVVASFFLNAPPTGTSTIVSAPVLSLSFSVGQPFNAGTGAWLLNGSATYQSPVLSGSVRVVSFTNQGSQTLTFVAQAILIGVPASS